MSNVTDPAEPAATRSQNDEAGEAAFAQISVLADGYCRGEWQNWYRGCKKLNVSSTLKRTREVLEQSRQE